MQSLLDMIARTGVSALAVAIIAAIAALFGTAASLTVSRRTVYINSVTAERSKWIDKLRNNIADLLAAAFEIYQLNGSLTGDKQTAAKIAETKSRIDSLYVNLHRVASVVSLQLNPEAEIDRNMIELVSFLRTSRAKTDMNALVAAHALLTRHSQWLLKFEWERVKYEASGPLRRLMMAIKRRRRAKAYKVFAEGTGALTALRQA